MAVSAASVWPRWLLCGCCRRPLVRGGGSAASGAQWVCMAAADPVDALVGSGDGEPVEDIDAVVYGR